MGRADYTRAAKPGLARRQGDAGTRFSASFILACLAEGVAYDDIVRDYAAFPRESIAEVLRFAAEVTDRHDVAA